MIPHAFDAEVMEDSYYYCNNNLCCACN